MKKYTITFAVIFLLASCGGNNSTETSSADKKDTVAKSASNDLSSNPDYANGLALVSKSDCLTCHKVNEVLIGPSYQDVANKYAGKDTALNYLTNKIITGGKGVWGQAIMTPHPLLAKADVEQMVKYILLLKTN